jgi:hypothetical protein
MIGISGWTLRSETGDPSVDADTEEWFPRRSWTRIGEGDWIEVVHKPDDS